MNSNCTAPSLDLYNMVRAGFVVRGTTLHGWCRNQGISMGNARDCLLGAWNGPKGRELRMRLVEESGIASSTSVVSQMQRVEA